MTKRLGSDEEPYAEGLEFARRLISGTRESTQNTVAPGVQLRARAAQTAAYLGLAEEAFTAHIRRFHQERLNAEPSLNVYPELKGSRDRLLERYRGMSAGGMPADLIALNESLSFWISYRMRREFGKIPNPVVMRALPERCRVIYLPESDEGPLHFKNIDDPLGTWKPQPPIPSHTPWPHAPLFFDGTGSGLHLDDEPPEIFPVNVQKLCAERCETVAEAGEFLVRYNFFWGSCNLLVHDAEGNSLAFDKASRCRVAIRHPEPSGLNYINGMSAFDEEYETFIRARRAEYLRLTGQAADSLEGCYFSFCEGVLRNMKRRMADLRTNPTREALEHMMTSRDADGPLCKSGKPCHPEDTRPGATLIQRLFFLDRKSLLRRQWRGQTPVWEDPWETIVYS